MTQYSQTQLVPSDEWLEAVTIVDPETGQPIDYSGYTVVSCTLQWVGLDTPIDVTVDKSGAVNGRFDLSLARADTANVPMGLRSVVRLKLASPLDAHETVAFIKIEGVETRTLPDGVTVQQLGLPGASVEEVLLELGISSFTVSINSPQPSDGEDGAVWFRVPVL